MDGGEGKEGPSLPPDYVSLAQLQERWLQKQQERKKQEEEKKNGGHGKKGGGSGSVGEVEGRRVEREGREMGAIEERGKGKQIVASGSGSGEENNKNNVKKKRKKKKKNRHFREKKSAGYDGKGKEVEKEEGRIEGEECDGGDGCEGVEIIHKNGLDGIKEIVNLFVGAKGEISDEKRTDFRGGMGRNGDNRGLRYKSGKESGVGLNELKQSQRTVVLGEKMEGAKGNGKQWRERRRNGEYYRERHNRVNENRPYVLEGSEVELEPEKKAEDEISEVFSKKCGLSGGDRDGVCGQSNSGGNKTKEDGVQGEGLGADRVVKKVAHEVVVVESAKYGKDGGVRNGYRRYGDGRGDFGDGRRYTSFGRFDNRRRVKQRDSGKMWVKKEEKSGGDAAEVGPSVSGILVDQE